MLPEDMPLDIFLRATEIYGVFIECRSLISVCQRGHLLNELERECIPSLMNYKELPQVRRIFEEYNKNIKMNRYDNRPVEL